MSACLNAPFPRCPTDRSEYVDSVLGLTICLSFCLSSNVMLLAEGERRRKEGEEKRSGMSWETSSSNSSGSEARRDGAVWAWREVSSWIGQYLVGSSTW